MESTSKAMKNLREYHVNRKNPVLSDLFRSKGYTNRGKEQVATKQETIRTKMTRGSLRAIISRRYKGAIAEKIVNSLPGFTIPQDFDSYVEIIEKLLNHDVERLFRIAFDIYDFNHDKLICELDTYANVQNFRDDDEVFVDAFSYDICIMGEALEEKRNSAGVTDFDSFTKIQAVQRKLQACGSTLDMSVLPDIKKIENGHEYVDWSDDETQF